MSGADWRPRANVCEGIRGRLHGSGIRTAFPLMVPTIRQAMARTPEVICRASVRWAHACADARDDDACDTWKRVAMRGMVEFSGLRSFFSAAFPFCGSVSFVIARIGNPVEPLPLLNR